MGEATAQRLAHPQAVWIANTNDDVNRLNSNDFKNKIEQGKQHFRIVAKHTPATQLQLHPTKGDLAQLLKLHNKDFRSHIDICISQRMSVIGNLATQLGK